MKNAEQSLAAESRRRPAVLRIYWLRSAEGSRSMKKIQTSVVLIMLHLAGCRGQPEQDAAPGRERMRSGSSVMPAQTFDDAHRSLPATTALPDEDLFSDLDDASVVSVAEVAIQDPWDLFPELNREAEILNVFEALFRHQFANNSSGSQQNALAYYLQIDGEDPTAEFLKRFRKHSPPVRKGSDFRQDCGGLLFRIDSWEWTGDTAVELTGGYYEANLSASGNRYKLVKRNGKWTVERDEMEWIS